MALTLVEAAKINSGDVLRSSIIEIFATESDLLQVMQFNDIPGNAWQYNREDTLPEVAFRGLNEAYTESTGVINPLTEALVIAGGDLDVDKFLTDTLGPDVRSKHEAMKAKKLAHTISNKMIKGDSTTDPKEFDGLQARLVIGGSQVIENDTGTGAALSLANLDALIDACDMPNYLLMNQQMRRRLTAAARLTTVGGFISFDQDAFGRTQTVYNGLPILLADRNQDVFNTLAFDEAAAGGGTASTSIYALSIGDGMLTGLQNGTIDVRDLGELQTQSLFRTRVEWYVSLALEHPRAASRLRGVTNAAVVV